MKKNGKELGHHYMFWDEYIDDLSHGYNCIYANKQEIEKLLKLNILKLDGHKLLWNLDFQLDRYYDLYYLSKNKDLFWIDNELYTTDECYINELPDEIYNQSYNCI